MTIRASRLVAALVLTATVAVAGAAQAQNGQVHLGPRMSYQFDLEEFGLGAQLSAPLVPRLDVYPSFDYYFVDPGSVWNVNADLKFRPSPGAAWLYLGGGLNVARTSVGDVTHTDAGVNAFLGMESRTGRVHPFAEFRFTNNDGSTGQISAGLNITLR
jgi:hypothetical protein